MTIHPIPGRKAITKEEEVAYESVEYYTKKIERLECILSNSTDTTSRDRCIRLIEQFKNTLKEMDDKNRKKKLEEKLDFEDDINVDDESDNIDSIDDEDAYSDEDD